MLSLQIKKISKKRFLLEKLLILNSMTFFCLLSYFDIILKPQCYFISSMPAQVLLWLLAPVHAFFETVALFKNIDLQARFRVCSRSTA